LNIAEIYAEYTPKDLILLSETPVLMNPIFSKLPPPEMNKHRFVVAKSGMYLEAQNEVLQVRLRIMDSPTGISLPCGEMTTGINLVNGAIPNELIRLVCQQAIVQAPMEWAGYIVWNRSDKEYQLFEPAILSKSAGHISYAESLPDNLYLVADLHSHGHGAAFFSATDNDSDSRFINSFYLAGVLGNCHSLDALTIKTRHVINANIINTEWHESIGFNINNKYYI
jgi:PRTRC genetic system protein A